jgi:hypothetical protein
MNQPSYPSVDEWMKREWYAAIKFYSAIKKSENISFTGEWMELEIIL